MSEKIETHYELLVVEVEGQRHVCIDSELMLHHLNDRRGYLDRNHKTAEEVALVPGGTEALEAWLSNDLPAEAAHNALRLKMELEFYPENADAARRMTPAQLWNVEEARCQETRPMSLEDVELIIGPRPVEKSLV